MQNVPQILIQKLNYKLANGHEIFTNLDLIFTKCKSGLVGKNGIGKSTLLKLITGSLVPYSGSIHVDGTVAYAPQNLSISTNETIAYLLGYADKINALQRILAGSIDIKDFTLLNDEWQIENHLQAVLTQFGLSPYPANHLLTNLSSGEVSRLLLAKVFLSNADFILLDEPTNHLDSAAKEMLYAYIKQWQGGMIIVSHDRELLDQLEQIIELNSLGACSFGGNFSFYQRQKSIEQAAIMQSLHEAKSAVQRTKHSIQGSKEKHEQRQSQGLAAKKAGGIPRLAFDRREERATRTKGRMATRSEQMLNKAAEKLDAAKAKLEISENIKAELQGTMVPNKKIILDVQSVCFKYEKASSFIIKDFNLKIQGPERIAIQGANGSGKTTLINLILGHLKPEHGKIYLGTQRLSYIDQNASLLNPEENLLNNFMRFNQNISQQDAYHSLAAFLFKNTDALNLAKDLSAGEKLRALLACVLLTSNPPQLLILDEPTNHLDINSILSIESALNNYKGAMIIISHDQQFLKSLEIEKIIYAPFIND